MAVKKDDNRPHDTSILPNSVEAEQSILCCILRDKNYQLDIIAKLNAEDFYQRNHQTIFEAILEISRANVTVDFATLIDMLRRQCKLAEVGDIDYITRLVDMLPSTAHFEEYLKIVVRASVLRKLIAACGEISALAYRSDSSEKVIAFAEQKIFELSQKGTDAGLIELSRTAAQALVTISKRFTSPESFHGIKSGYSRLDKLTNGFHGGELIVIAARPGVGKSALAMNMVENIATDGHTVAIYSLEMSNEQLMERMLSSMSGVPLSEIKSGSLSRGENDISRLASATEIIHSKMHLFGNDNPNVRVAEIRSQCRRLKQQGKLDLIVVDYIGLMQGDDAYRREGRQNEVASITRGLKIMAKELDVPVIALSQLKRDAEIRNLNSKDKSSLESMPVLSDLRESGAIEQDADIVMFIHREKAEEDQPKFTLAVAKHRNGETGNIPLVWRGDCVRFEDDRMFRKFAHSYQQQEKQVETSGQPVDYGVGADQQFEMNSDIENNQQDSNSGDIMPDQSNNEEG